LISSGSGNLFNPDSREALIVQKYLLEIGIPSRDILVESESRNTRQNAVNSAEILNKSYPNGKFILVTSGYHIPRAEKCFKKLGIDVTLYGVDHYAGFRKYSLRNILLPKTYALFKWDLLIHEWVGMVSYKIMGYV